MATAGSQLQLLLKLLQNLDISSNQKLALGANDTSPNMLLRQLECEDRRQCVITTTDDDNDDNHHHHHDSSSLLWESPERQETNQQSVDETPQKEEKISLSRNDDLNNVTLDLLKSLMNAESSTTTTTAEESVTSEEPPSNIADMMVLNNLLRSLQTEETAEASTSNEEEVGLGGGVAGSSVIFLPDGSLNLDLFKVYLCKNESHIHDRKNCPFYHTHRDRRRMPTSYRAEQCDDSFDLEDEFQCMCPRGEGCDKCHNRHELLYHPAIYKQRFCSSYNHVLIDRHLCSDAIQYLPFQQRSVQCHRGRFCAFAHSRAGIRCQLFPEEAEKGPDSLWCPYGIQHDWHGCLYAHTYQDCRRSPLIAYGSEPCPYWQKDLHSADYKRRCPYGTRCPYSHGSKEQLYHPAYYKTMPCADYKVQRSCPRGHLCAFYHDTSEKRPASCEGGRAPVVYDYGRPLRSITMSYLQRNFMSPPLFNLDDFEAFGHGSRVESHRRSSERGKLGFPESWQGESPKQRNNKASCCSSYRHYKKLDLFEKGFHDINGGGSFTERHISKQQHHMMPENGSATSTAFCGNHHHTSSIATNFNHHPFDQGHQQQQQSLLLSSPFLLTTTTTTTDNNVIVDKPPHLI